MTGAHSENNVATVTGSTAKAELQSRDPGGHPAYIPENLPGRSKRAGVSKDKLQFVRNVYFNRLQMTRRAWLGTAGRARSAASEMALAALGT